MNKKNFTLKEFLQKKEIIVSFVVYCLGNIFSVTFLSEKNMNKNILTFLNKDVNLGTVLTIILSIVFLLFLFFSYAIQKEKEAEKQIVIAKKDREKWEKARRKLNSSSTEDKGESIFNLAIGLDTYEPVKYRLLEEAAMEHNHVLSAIYLGNLYHSGLMKGKRTIIEKNHSKAYELYMHAANFDTTGIALWRLGWMYELGQAPDTSKDTTENQKFAFDYYKRSSDYGYPKAYNSIGKFQQLGLAGLTKNTVDAHYNYKMADSGGDIFATLNSAYIHAEKEESFSSAIDCFERAMSKNSPLAHLKFADFLVENYDYFQKKYSHWDIIEFYCKAIELTTSDISAKAYFNLGKLLQNDILGFNKYKEKTASRLSLDFDEDIEKACNLKAYDILKTLSNQGVSFTKSTQKFYEKIKNYINNGFVYINK